MGRPGRQKAGAGAWREMGKGYGEARLGVPPPPPGTVCAVQSARWGASVRGRAGALREGKGAGARKSWKTL